VSTPGMKRFAVGRFNGQPDLRRRLSPSGGWTRDAIQCQPVGVPQPRRTLWAMNAQLSGPIGGVMKADQLTFVKLPVAHSNDG
jgi:hypothetical protein